jgi:hypothetical protein
VLITAAQRRTYNQAYRAKNLDALRAYDLARRAGQATKAARNAKSKAWYAANRVTLRARRNALALARHDETMDARRAYNQAYRDENRERLLAGDRAYHAMNRAARLAAGKVRRAAKIEDYKRRDRAYYQAHRAQALAGIKAYHLAHPGKKRALHAKRRAAKRHATPVWANHRAIEAIYVEAVRLTRETGIKHHVDHYYPLLSDVVCGLHVEYNLQILTEAQNIRKHNKHPDRIAA